MSTDRKRVWDDTSDDKNTQEERAEKENSTNNDEDDDTEDNNEMFSHKNYDGFTFAQDQKVCTMNDKTGILNSWILDS